jgi:hypothetical protein
MEAEMVGRTREHLAGEERKKIEASEGTTEVKNGSIQAR